MADAVESFDVAIIGAGNVGAALARTFKAGGARVTLGVRTPEPVQRKFEPEGICVATPADALQSAEIVVLAVPGNVAVKVAAEHADALADKILVDCNNPVQRVDGGIAWAAPAEGSLAQAIAAAVPRARVVKGFNGFGAEFHAQPDLAGSPAQVLLASDDSAAKARVSALASQSGFAPIDAGPLRNAALVENMAVMWIHLAIFGGQGRDFVFGMQRAPK